MPFQKGHKGGPGRPKKTRTTLEIIKNRVLNCLQRRLSLSKELEDVPTIELLKFAQYLMPKELNANIDVSHQYQISENDRTILMSMLQGWSRELIDEPKMIDAQVIDDGITS